MQTKIYEADTYYKFGMFSRNWVATSGIMNFAETNQCYWLLDMVASYIPTLNTIKNIDYLLVIKLTLTDQPFKSDSTDEPCNAYFTISHEVEGTQVEIIRQDIVFTDLESNVVFWAINQTETGYYEPHNQTVLLLPEEY
jgi:hypothetical protein